MSNNESSAKEMQKSEVEEKNESRSAAVKKQVPSESKPKTNDGSFKSDKIIIGKNESLDSALRRFKRQSSGVISEVRKREAYDKPSVKRKKKSKEARKKNKKRHNYF